MDVNETTAAMGKQTRSNTSGNLSDNKHEQKFQAVLLADSFSSSFRPITLDRSTPKVLCPLNNVTMIDYAIEFLAGAGVEELYVFCVTSGEMVESYLESSSWARSKRMNIKCVKDSSVTNAGDALRYAYVVARIIAMSFHARFSYYYS